MSQNHERLSAPVKVQGSSDRAFGLVFAAVFAIIGLWPLVGGGSLGVWWLAASGAVLALALLKPSLLAVPNRLWTRFGLFLHSVTSPVILGLLFYVTVTPMGLAMRAFGKDPLRLRFESKVKSYWIERQPPGPAPETMKNQF